MIKTYRLTLLGRSKTVRVNWLNLSTWLAFLAAPVLILGIRGAAWGLYLMEG